MGALALVGVPPEEYWQHVVADFDKDRRPSAMPLPRTIRRSATTVSTRLGLQARRLLNKIKTNLGGGLPSIFGFTVYAPYTQAAATGKIPYPTPGEKIVGGHAVVAVGYDDSMKIKNTNPGAVEKKGALLIEKLVGNRMGQQRLWSYYPMNIF